MHPFPHTYVVNTTAGPGGPVVLRSGRLDPLPTATPPEFGGPGDCWSPETMLVGAVADCLVLTFRGIAAVSKLPWSALSVDVAGKLDRVDRVTRFTSFTIRAVLEIPAGVSEDQARRLLTKAEETCLITRSLTASVDLQIDVRLTELVG
jgi:organic hydroperoxide reductase OsmC/OhrA